MGAASGVLIAGVLAPLLDDGLQTLAGVNVAVFANPKKQDAVNDTLAGFRELVIFQQFVVVVVFPEVRGKVAPRFVEEFQKVCVKCACAVRLNEPLLTGFARAGGFLGQGVQCFINAAVGNLVPCKQVPQLAGNERELAEVPVFPFANVRLVNVGLAADDIDFQFFKIREQGHPDAFVPSVAFGLEGVAGMKFLGRLLGLADKSVAFVGAEKIIGTLASTANLRGAFNLDFAFTLNQTSAVFHVPTECAEKRI